MIETHTVQEIKTPAQRGAPPEAQRQASRWSGLLSKRRAVIVGTQVLLTVIILGAWQILSNNGAIDSQIVGSPSGIYDELREMIRSGEAWTNAQATLVATVLGFAIGSAAGIVFGLVLGWSDFSDRVFSPLITVLNSMPRIAFAPLLIVWFGLTVWAKVFVAASLCIFILLLNTRAAARSVDRDLLMLSRINRLNPLDHFRKIVLPSAMPAIFAGLRLSIVYSFLGVIASEMVVARDGLGTLVIKYSSAVLNVDALFGVLVVIAVMAAVLTALLAIGERRALSWQEVRRS